MPQKCRPSSQWYTLVWLKTIVSRPFRLWQNLTKYSEVEPIFGCFQAPRGPRDVQGDPRWFQTIGTMSHTMPQPSQVALCALKSQNWEKFDPNCPKNSHFGVYFGGFKLPGPPIYIQISVNQSQATATLSHTMSQLSQMLFWALKSRIWQKSDQKCTKTFFKLVDQKSPFLSLENLLFLAPKTLKTTFKQKSYFYFESII